MESIDKMSLYLLLNTVFNGFSLDAENSVGGGDSCFIKSGDEYIGTLKNGILDLWEHTSAIKIKEQYGKNCYTLDELTAMLGMLKDEI